MHSEKNATLISSLDRAIMMLAVGGIFLLGTLLVVASGSCKLTLLIPLINIHALLVFAGAIQLFKLRRDHNGDA